MMKRPEKPSGIDFCDDVNDAFMSVCRMRDVVKRQDYTCNKLESKQKKHNAAGEIQPLIFMGRDKL
jgi:hypothetical protein